MGSVNIMNGIASGLAAAGGYVPNSVKNSLTYLSTELKTTDGLKTILVKPAIAVGTTLDYLKIAGQHSVLNAMGTLGTTVKVVICGVESITKTPKTFETLSRGLGGTTAEEIAADANEHTKRSYQDLTGKLVNTGSQLTDANVLSNRMFSFCNWLICVADAVALFRKINLHSPLLDRVTPWIYAVGGGFMGGNAIYSDAIFAHETWSNSSNKERIYQVVSLALDAAYIGQSLVGGIGIYMKREVEPRWVSNLRVVSAMGACLLPATQKFLGDYIKSDSKKVDKIS